MLPERQPHPAAGTETPVLFVENGTYFHHRTLHTPEFAPYFGHTRHVLDLQASDFEQYRSIVFCCNTRGDLIARHRAAIADFLQRGNTVVAMGNTAAHTWLPQVQWHDRPVNFWWWTEPGADSGLRVAEWLQGRPEVSRVLYPPLLGAVGHDLWARDFNGAASLMGVVMKGGDTAAGRAFLDALSLFGMGYSWGGFESLVTHETHQMAYRSHPPSLEGELIRLHVGLEDPADLIADLERGLAAFSAALTLP